jgi:Repeat of unknown function (DUF5648)
MRFEGSTFSVAPAASTDGKQVFRLANLNNGAYLFTSSAPERDYAVSLGNWRFEGLTFRAPKGSVLTDRAFDQGKLVATGSTRLRTFALGIADNGLTHSIFVDEGASPLQRAVYATRGTPNSSQSIDWSVAQSAEQFWGSGNY